MAGEVFERRLGAAWPECLLIASEPGQRLPSIAERGPLLVIFDGTLHNRAELERLGRGEGPVPQSDASLVLNTWAVLGIEGTSRIRGLFALIVSDARRQSIVCARDPLGVYPLYYAEAGHNLFVSPAIDLLLAHGISREPNRLSLAGFIVDLAPRPEETFFAAVKRVPPGHRVEVSRRTSQPAAYWELESCPNERGIDGEEALLRFDALLRQAVRRCLEFGPAGVWLSGGVDSTAVAVALASESRDQRAGMPWALSLVFSDPACNEEDLQRTIAAHLGLPQLIGPLEDFVPPEGLLLSSLDLSRQSCVPPQSFWQLPYDRLAAAGKELGCAVVLSGDGGDEWLQPPPLLAANRLMALDLASVERLRRGWEAYYPISRRQSFRSAFWLYGARPLLRATVATALQKLRPDALYAYRHGQVQGSLPRWLAPDPGLRAELIERALQEASASRPSELYDAARKARWAQPWLLHSLESAFERSRKVGVRILAPLLDVDLLAFLDRTAPELVNHAGMAKGLARRLALDAIPMLGPDWPKKVHAQAFWISTMKQEGRLAAAALRGMSSLAALGIVDAQTLESEVDMALSSSGIGGAERIWEALSLEAWLNAG